MRYGTDRVLPRTHMTLRVDVDGVPILADVGFGADGLLLPVAMDGEPSRQFGWSYRVVEGGGTHVLQTRRDAVWDDLYAFTHEPQLPVDYEIANHYTSTHPSSRFTQRLTAQRLAADVRWTLRDRELLEDRGATTRTRDIGSDDELVEGAGGYFRAPISRCDAVRAAARRKLTPPLATRGGIGDNAAHGRARDAGLFPPNRSMPSFAQQLRIRHSPVPQCSPRRTSS